MRLSLLCIAAVLGLLGGCHHSPKPTVLVIEGLGSPSEVAARALLSRAEVTGLAGEKVSMIPGEISREDQSASGPPIIKDIFPSTEKLHHVVGQEYIVTGEKGSASLFVEVKLEGRGRWKLNHWEVMSGAARQAAKAKLGSLLKPLPNPEGFQKAILDAVTRSFPADSTREVYVAERSFLRDPSADRVDQELPVVIVRSGKPLVSFTGFVAVRQSKDGWKAGKANHWERTDDPPDTKGYRRVE